MISDLGELAHVVVRRVRLVRLEHRELRVVPRRQALVAKHAADLVDARVAADDEPLEVQLDGDAQVHVGVQRVPVRLEGQRVTATRDRLQDGCLDLDKAALIERRPQRANQPGPGGEVAALRGVAEQVEIALAVARLLVLESVELLGRRMQRLDEQRHGVDEHRRLTATRARDRTRDADDVAEVEHRHHRVRVAGAIGAKPRLQATRTRPRRARTPHRRGRAAA